MEKNHIIFALKLFIIGALLGILAGALRVKPLGISQEQVIPVLFSIFFGLGLITAILTFYFIRKSHKAYQSYQREEEDEENEQDYIAMYRFLDYGTVAWNVSQISMLFCMLLDLGRFGISATSLLLIVVSIWSGVYCLKITSKIRNYKLSVMATPKEVLEYLDTYDEGEKQAEMEEAYLILFKVNQLHTRYLYCFSSSIYGIRTSTVGCSAGGSCHPFVHECCTVAKNKTLFQIGESYENTSKYRLV